MAQRVEQALQYAPAPQLEARVTPRSPWEAQGPTPTSRDGLDTQADAVTPDVASPPTIAVPALPTSPRDPALPTSPRDPAVIAAIRSACPWRH